MRKRKSYEIKMVIIDKELNNLIKSLEKSGGSYSESLLHLILYQKEKQDNEFANKEQ
jgi:hypothetical protein